MEKFMGFVQMPLERYDELILDNKRMMDELDNSVSLEEYNELQELLDSVVKIEADWENEPSLKIDLSVLAAKINEKFEQSEFMGFVQMPLERYDELILDNKRMMDELDNSVSLEEYNELQELLDSVVKIEADWENEPSLKIDLSVLAAKINEKFEQSEFTGEWTMEDVSKRKETVWGVFERIKHDEDEEDQA